MCHADFNTFAKMIYCPLYIASENTVPIQSEKNQPSLRRSAVTSRFFSVAHDPNHFYEPPLAAAYSYCCSLKLFTDTKIAIDRGICHLL